MTEDVEFLRHIVRSILDRDKLLIKDLLEEKNNWRKNVESLLNTILLHESGQKEWASEFSEALTSQTETIRDLEKRVQRIEYEIKADKSIRRLSVSILADIFNKLFGKEPDYLEDETINRDSGNNLVDSE